MLYKKIHRQYVKEFRMGRRFISATQVEKIVTGKPYINHLKGYICVKCNGLDSDWVVVSMTDDYSFTGQLWYIDRITWLED